MLIPEEMASKTVTIKTDVNNQTPLLLSKESMKCAGTKIEFLEDKVHLFVKCKFTFYIHCAISLNDSYEGSTSLDDSRFIEIFLTIDKLRNKSQTEKVRMKSHRQFGHPKGS